MCWAVDWTQLALCLWFLEVTNENCAFIPSKACDKLSGSNLGMQLIVFNYALFLLG